MSSKDKKQYRKDAMNEVLSITPDMMDELAECPLGDNLTKMQTWEAKYWNPMVLKDAVAKNYVKHGIKLLILMGEAYSDYAQNDFYDLGYEVGQMANLLITDGEDKEKDPQIIQ